MYKGKLIKLSADFSAEILDVRKEWLDIFKVLKIKNFKLKIIFQQVHPLELKEILRVSQRSKGLP